jgi:glycosyltransferase involved in cell wall biosynthesis
VDSVDNKFSAPKGFTVVDSIKVCSVINSLTLGGAEHLLLSLVTALDEVSFTVAFFTGDTALFAPLRKAGAQIYNLEESFRFDPRAAVRLRRLLRDDKFDIVHSHLPYSQTVGRVVAQSKSDMAVVSTQHNVPSNYHPVVRVSERFTRPLDDVTVAVSKGVEQAHTGTAHQPNRFGDDWCTIYNGIDVDSFRESLSTVDGEAVRHKFDIDQSTPVFLTVGRYVPVKAQRELIAGFAEADLSDAVLLIVGHGPLEQDLRDTTYDHGVADQVSVVGRVPEIYPYYAAADVFVSLSRAEGLPVTLLEAMAAGLPVIASDIPGVREVVADGETGRLVPVGDSAELQKALVEFLDSEWCRFFGRAGLKRVRDRFNIEQMAEGYRTLYRSLTTES